MLIRPRAAVVAVVLLLFTFAPAWTPVRADRAADRKAEKERKKAWEEAKEAFEKGYRSEDPKVRREAVRKLADFTDMGAVELLVENVVGKERNYGVLDSAIRIIGATKDPAIISWLVKTAKGKKKWLERTAVVEAFARIDDPGVTGALVHLLKKEEDSRVLAMALAITGEKGLREQIDLVIPHLEHEDWQVRLAAIEALGSFKEEKGVIHLIDRLMNERGRLRHDIQIALKKITGKDFGRDANAWRKWFHEKDEKPEGDPKPPENPPAGKGGGGSVVKEPTYFGIKVVSDRVLFIIDVSKSMKTAIDIDKMKLMRDAATTGDEKDGENKDDEKFESTIQWWKIKDRLDLAKAHLAFVIKNLRADQQFEMVSFSEKITPWNGGKVIKAKTRNKLRAVNWIEELDVEEATAAGAALDFAFEMAGPGAADKNYRSGVDTIFFLSDGAPSDRNSDEILEEVRMRNRLRKIRIHVIAILNFSTPFLRKLAEQNGGVYKFFKVENKE
ncbi:MAG: HEAT repeat domain-containing protein [Planctomycetota bacterium]